MEPAQPPQIVALVKDLILGSRILAVAETGGVNVRLIRDPAKLAGVPGRLLLVDLNLPGAIESAIAWQTPSSEHDTTSRTTVGFVSHVDEATIRRAREAGIGRVMARSAFVAELPSLVTLA